MVNGFAGGLLRGHVGQFAFDQTLVGMTIVTGGLGDTEIDNFNLTFIGQKYILRVDIAMDDIQRPALQVL